MTARRCGSTRWTCIPQNPIAENNLGNALAARGEFGEAIDHYQKALEINPDYVEAHNNLGLALAGRGQVNAAMAQYRKALEIDADCQQAHNNLGLALAGRGQFDEAIAHYRRALKINPELPGGLQQPGVRVGRPRRV